MGTLDRSLRTAAALVIGILLLANLVSGITATILGIVALVFLATSAAGFCPLYAPLRISTRKKPALQQH